MKDLCVKLGGLGAMLICIPVIYRINQGDIFNPASFFLWSCLSIVSVIVLTRAKKGGATLIGGYVLSDLSIGITAYQKGGKTSIGSFEWFIIFLTALCAAVYVWCELRENFKPAVIINATALMVAGMPQVLDSWEKPYQANFMIGGLYLLVSALSYYGEKPTLNGRLIPGLSILYWLVIFGGVLIARSRT